MTVETPAAAVPAESPEPGIRGSFVQRFMTAGGDNLAASVSGVIAFALAAIDAVEDWVALVFVALTLAVVVFAGLRSERARPGSAFPTGSFVAPRVLVALALGALYVDASDTVDWILVAVLALLLIAEPSYSRVARGAIPYAAHVPGLHIRNAGPFTPKAIFYANTVGLVVAAALLIAFDVPAVALLTVVAIAAVLMAYGLADGVLRVRGRRSAEQRITQLLTTHAPAFAVHWDAEPGTAYQLKMWLPYLDRLGEKYIVIVRNQNSFAEITGLTAQPVLLRKALVDMDAMIVPSLKAAFYVNNGVRNAHFARYTQLTHVQLNHGDSDKAPSYNPVFRMFDKNFVAGQAAIDRFTAQGIQTRDDFFEIVGRPQVEDVQLAAATGRSGEGTRVLYAPTWAGFNADSAYSSLTIGVSIVQALLRRGCTVVYRPHPYTDRSKQLAAASERIKQLLEQDAKSSARAHVWGKKAERDLSVFDCFNAVDAMVADVSSVVPDFLYSEKPFAVCAMQGDVENFEQELPIVRGGYAIASDASNLDEVLDQLLGADPRRGERHALKTYYLGDFAAERYADAFLDAARKVLV